MPHLAGHLNFPIIAVSTNNIFKEYKKSDTSGC